MSYEPAWGPLDFRAFLAPEEGHPFRLDWLIAGGQSGAGATPSHPQWFRDARDACQATGRAFFFKQWGEYSPLSRTDGVHELPFMDYNVATRFGFLKQGKNKSGALLDGREWRQMPPVARIERFLQSPGSLISEGSTETGTALKESL